MEREECAAKVGAGETAVCEGCGLPLAQALGETDVCKCPGGLRKPSEFSETSVWLFECWDKARKRDQAAIAALNSRMDARFEKIIQAERARHRLGWLLSAAAGAVCGAVAAAAYLSAGV